MRITYLGQFFFGSLKLLLLGQLLLVPGLILSQLAKLAHQLPRELQRADDLENENDESTHNKAHQHGAIYKLHLPRHIYQQQIVGPHWEPCLSSKCRGRSQVCPEKYICLGKDGTINHWTSAGILPRDRGGHILDCTYLTLLQISNFLLNNGNSSLYRGLLDLGCPILLGLGDNRRHDQACNTRLDD